MTITHTISEIAKNKLCHSCGTCAGVCPRNAIEMQLDECGIFIPIVKTELCNNCGICNKVCPSKEFDYSKFQKKIHGRLPEHTLIGNFISCFDGAINDDLIHRRVQSGGFVSAILCYMLEKRIIDGAIVTAWDYHSPLKPKTYIARDKNEILHAAGSKYLPVPTNVILKEILKTKAKYAFVGTSCQIHGLRKFEDINPCLSNTVILYIGLHCHCVYSFHFIDHILAKYQLKREDITCFDFRSKNWRGWPCDMRLLLKSGKIINIPSNISRSLARGFFSTWRCHLCYDKANEFSDISCGDCRVPSAYGKPTLAEINHNTLGRSDIIVRTKRAKIIFDRFLIETEYKVQPANHKSIAQSLKISEKKIGSSVAYHLTKFICPGLPKNSVHFSFCNMMNQWDFFALILSMMNTFWLYISRLMLKYPFYRKLLVIMPTSWLIKFYRITSKFLLERLHGNETEMNYQIKKSELDNKEQLSRGEFF